MLIPSFVSMLTSNKFESRLCLLIVFITLVQLSFAKLKTAALPQFNEISQDLLHPSIVLAERRLPSFDYFRMFEHSQDV